jgi:hypothetical protein
MYRYMNKTVNRLYAGSRIFYIIYEIFRHMYKLLGDRKDDVWNEFYFRWQRRYQRRRTSA